MVHTLPGWRGRVAVLLMVLAAAVGGCASTGGGGAERQDMNLISADELSNARAQGVADLEDLIQRLRPRWLETGRVQSFSVESSILVYDNSNLIGGIDILNTLTLDQVREVRWLRSAEAGTLPGAGGTHVEGAIVIVRD